MTLATPQAQRPDHSLPAWQPAAAAALERAWKHVGSRQALARLIDVPQSTFSRWCTSGIVEPEAAIPIVRAVGGIVTPHELRPDIYPDTAWMPDLECSA